MRQTYNYRCYSVQGMSVKHCKALGERIKFYRKSMRMSQSDLCKLVQSISLEKGVKFTQADLSNYERGKYCPKIDKLTSLCVATGMPAYWFAGYDIDLTNDHKTKAELHIIKSAA